MFIRTSCEFTELSQKINKCLNLRPYPFELEAQAKQSSWSPLPLTTLLPLTVVFVFAKVLLHKCSREHRIDPLVAFDFLAVLSLF